MAGASMKDIKLRIKSVESTMQITKAMELVASSKLRKAKERQERCRPYFTGLHADASEASRRLQRTIFPRPIIAPASREKDAALIVIAGDRGLAGGYNSQRV
ncbi:MAG: FoF1 ATP synthase subunit gamma [Christensenellales bacterium]